MDIKKISGNTFRAFAFLFAIGFLPRAFSDVTNAEWSEKLQNLTPSQEDERQAKINAAYLACPPIADVRDDGGLARFFASVYGGPDSWVRYITDSYRDPLGRHYQDRPDLQCALKYAREHPPSWGLSSAPTSNNSAETHNAPSISSASMAVSAASSAPSENAPPQNDSDGGIDYDEPDNTHGNKNENGHNFDKRRVSGYMGGGGYGAIAVYAYRTDQGAFVIGAPTQTVADQNAVSDCVDKYHPSFHDNSCDVVARFGPNMCAVYAAPDQDTQRNIVQGGVGVVRSRNSSSEAAVTAETKAERKAMNQCESRPGAQHCKITVSACN